MVEVGLGKNFYSGKNDDLRAQALRPFLPFGRKLSVTFRLELSVCNLRGAKIFMSSGGAAYF